MVTKKKAQDVMSLVTNLRPFWNLNAKPVIFTSKNLKTHQEQTVFPIQSVSMFDPDVLSDEHKSKQVFSKWCIQWAPFTRHWELEKDNCRYFFWSRRIKYLFPNRHKMFYKFRVPFSMRIWLPGGQEHKNENFDLRISLSQSRSNKTFELANVVCLTSDNRKSC